MALPARPGMRLLSQRLAHLQRCNAAHTQFRLASRYSKPTRREVAGFGSADQLPAFDTPAATSNASKDGKDPLLLDDPVGKWVENQKRLKKRRTIALYGVIASFIGAVAVNRWAEWTGLTGQLNTDSSKEANEKFQGKEVHVIGVGDGKRIVAEGPGETIDLVETGTSSVPHFPKVIYLPTATESDATDPNAIAVPNSDANPGNRANMEEYTLLGLGIRSVSFLGIQVYVMGMYVRTTDLTSLQAKLIHSVNPAASTLIPSEKGDLEAKLLNAEASTEFWQELLKVPGIKTAWRISPTRNTDFAHLRDGWITGINKRTAEAKKKSGNVPSEYDREEFGLSMRSFMSIFQGGKAPKGSVMTLSRTADGGLDVFFAAKPGSNGKEKETQKLGSIGDERISKLIWLNYLAGDKVSSEPARKGVAEGCVALASRPVGSAETMVA